MEAKTRLIEITGEGENYEFINDKGIKVNEGGFISFTDSYNLINKSFTLKIWLDAPAQDNLLITKLLISIQIRYFTIYLINLLKRRKHISIKLSP